jgi:hypothetical protein
LLIEADTDKSDQFALIDTYLQRIADTDEGSICSITTSDSYFEAAAIAPAATINTCQFLYHFACLDSCYTLSKYHIILLIAVGIDTNSNILPLAWAIVPTENEEWWL